MDDTNSLIEQRKAKLNALLQKGINPFMNKCKPDCDIGVAREQFEEGKEICLAGRITAYRDMGKSLFFDIRDQSGRIQVYAQKQILGEEQFALFKHLDIGDFLGAWGKYFKTRTGEISIKLESFTEISSILAVSLSLRSLLFILFAKR